jgi:hypothetical protein
MTFADLRALHAIIGAAIDDIERIYRPPPSSRRTSQSSMFPGANSLSSATNSQPRSSSKPRSSLSIDSDIAVDDTEYGLPLTPVSMSNSQAGQNSVHFASTNRMNRTKVRERSYTTSSIPQPNSNAPGPIANMPLQILKQPPLDFPDLDTPIILPNCGASFPDISGFVDRPLSPSPHASLSSTSAPELENVSFSGVPALLDPTQRQREWRKKCDDLTAHPEVIKATNKIVAACAQIGATVQKPFLTICDAAMGVSALDCHHRYLLTSCVCSIIYPHACDFLRRHTL